MGKFDEYSYKYTLQRLDNWYDSDTDKTNYAQVLLGMNNCTTFEECAKIYKKVYLKYEKYSGDGYKTSRYKYFVEDLNTCLNENLLRLLQQNVNLDNALALKYLANIRQCDETRQHQQKWEAIVKEKGLKVPENSMTSILEAQKKYEEAKEEYQQKDYSYKSKSNGFKRVSKVISDNLNILKSYGYEVLLTDVNFSIRSNFQMFFICLGCFGLFALFIAFCYLLSFASNATISIIVLLIGCGSYFLFYLRDNGKI